jgi:hypothetical protein
MRGFTPHRVGGKFLLANFINSVPVCIAGQSDYGEKGEEK